MFKVFKYSFLIWHFLTTIIHLNFLNAIFSTMEINIFENISVFQLTKKVVVNISLIKTVRKDKWIN